MTQEPGHPIGSGAKKVFISYAHQDEALRQRLDAHLSLMQRQGLIAGWHDRQLRAGMQWAKEIDSHLEEAAVILLLISADFVASDYCYGIEMQRALLRQQAGQALVVPVIVRPVDWTTAPFARLQALPTNGKAITAWKNRDEAFADVAAGLRKALAKGPTPGVSSEPLNRRVPTRARAGLLAIALLLILLFGGIGGYVMFFRDGTQHETGTGGQQGASKSGSQGGQGTGLSSGSPAARGLTTESLNLRFTYASEAITLTSVQEAITFPDDLQPYQGKGLVRITLNENNPSRWHAGFGLFSDVAHVLLPEGSTADVSAVKSDGGLDADASRTNNWIDFAAPSAVSDLSKLVLRMGKATEHQMDIPLLPNADLSPYQDKTITPNTPVSYAGLNWTLQSVTISLSGAKGAQATAGMHYVILSLRVDNPTSHDVVIGFPEHYLRLKATDTTGEPIVDTMTLPGHAPANTTNVTGTVFFLMPEQDTSFTLEWLVSKNQVYDPVSDTQVNTLIQFP